MKNKTAIVTIHGIKWRSETDWQNDFGDYAIAKSLSEDKNVKVFHFRYGRVMALTSWLMSSTKFLRMSGFLRRRYIKAFCKFIRKIQKKLPDYEVSILAHSFGGWLTYEMLTEYEDLEFKNIIFAHCPISSHIENTSFWNWLQFEKIKSVFCWCSHNDDVIGKIAIKPFGQNGFWGFIRYGHDEDRQKPNDRPYAIKLYNIFTNEKHSGILEKYPDKLFDQLISN